MTFLKMPLRECNTMCKFLFRFATLSRLAVCSTTLQSKMAFHWMIHPNPMSPCLTGSVKSQYHTTVLGICSSKYCNQIDKEKHLHCTIIYCLTCLRHSTSSFNDWFLPGSCIHPLAAVWVQELMSWSLLAVSGLRQSKHAAQLKRSPKRTPFW
jgi:hypothetical protein